MSAVSSLVRLLVERGEYDEARSRLDEALEGGLAHLVRVENRAARERTIEQAWYDRYRVPGGNGLVPLDARKLTDFGIGTYISHLLAGLCSAAEQQGLSVAYVPLAQAAQLDTALLEVIDREIGLSGAARALDPGHVVTELADEVGDGQRSELFGEAAQARRHPAPRCRRGWQPRCAQARRAMRSSPTCGTLPVTRWSICGCSSMRAPSNGWRSSPRRG